MPAHHNLEAYLDAYLEAADYVEAKKSPLFRSARGRTGELTENPMHRVDVYRMIRRRARARASMRNLLSHLPGLRDHGLSRQRRHVGKCSAMAGTKARAQPNSMIGPGMKSRSTKSRGDSASARRGTGSSGRARARTWCWTTREAGSPLRAPQSQLGDCVLYVLSSRSVDISVAFVREESAEAAQEVSLPPRAISAHPNLVTQCGLRALERALADSQQALKAAQAIADANDRRRALELAARDVRYFRSASRARFRSLNLVTRA